MTVDAPVRHLPVRLQWLAGLAVVLIFGGGAAIVWKWSHIKVWYRLHSSTSQISVADLRKGSLVEIRREAPSDWIPVDLGIVALAIPSPIRECKMGANGGLTIATGSCTITFTSISAGRALLSGREQDLQQLLPDGTYAPISFVDYATRAALAGSEDFRWLSSQRELWQFEGLLLFKALMPGEAVRPALVFRGFYTKGLIQYRDPDRRRTAMLTISPYDDGDLVIFQVEPAGRASDDVVFQVAASVRFPGAAHDGSPAALDALVERQVTVLRGFIARDGRN